MEKKRESLYMRALKRKRELIKENPEYQGKIVLVQEKDIFCTSNKDFLLLLELERLEGNA